MFDKIKEIIENSNFDGQLIETSSDGRINSALSEDIIYNHVKNILGADYQLEKMIDRYWYDMSIKYKDEFFPINIKISTGDSADNASSKKGLFYAMTGIMPENIKGIHTWVTFNKELLNNFNYNTNADYYYLVYFKNDNKFLFTSLKRLNKVVVNSNNLPFQIKWKDNLEYTERSVKEQCLYLVKQFIVGYKQQLKGIEYLNQFEQIWGLND